MLIFSDNYQTLECSFSSVSKPIFATKYSFCSTASKRRRLDGPASLTPLPVRQPICTRRAGKLYRARSLLYRSRFFATKYSFCNIFQNQILEICNPLHRSDLKISAKFHQTFSYFCYIFRKNHCFSIVFTEFCTDFDKNFSEFRRIFQKMMKDR